MGMLASGVSVLLRGLCWKERKQKTLDPGSARPIASLAPLQVSATGSKCCMIDGKVRQQVQGHRLRLPRHGDLGLCSWWLIRVPSGKSCDPDSPAAPRC